jgi:hypothetical protein
VPKLRRILQPMTGRKETIEKISQRGASVFENFSDIVRVLKLIR